ncbi:hypothetical protein EYF80_063283 [Liparis tanakae]|uniref:Uncharacterized protein n=1 Tax=Liparis tanakae TaxID=230148 RepID=A0A4Z2ECV9_9TELE|nr:hypothetical protein EYF80_063283 [Liparis tanakae]
MSGATIRDAAEYTATPDLAANYRNPAFTHDESAVHSPEPVDYRRPAPVYQLNGPALDADLRQWGPSAGIRPSSPTAYGHNGPFSNAGLSTSLNLREFPHNPVSAAETECVQWRLYGGP